MTQNVAPVFVLVVAVVVSETIFLDGGARQAGARERAQVIFYEALLTEKISRGQKSVRESEREAWSTR